MDIDVDEEKRWWEWNHKDNPKEFTDRIRVKKLFSKIESLELNLDLKIIDYNVAVVLIEQLPVEHEGRNLWLDLHPKKKHAEGSMSIHQSMKPEIHDAIQAERDYQDKKWGNFKAHPHTVMEWIAIMEGELQEAKQGWLKGDGKTDALKEVLQVVATGVACMEQHGAISRRL